MSLTARSLRPFLILAVLVVGGLALYWPVLGHEFVFDDSDYITGDPWMRAGLTPANLRRAFTTFQAANWHPLTWISLCVDGRLSGMSPAGCHLHNLALHLASGGLLFAVLSALTGSTWRSALVAALFISHPQHVESVAWAAQRKDVLSMFFLVLSIAAYLRYVKRPGPARLGAVAAAFCLGLLAKPMLVTLPFVLLLLDWWPLGRPDRRLPTFSAWRPLVVEKIPLFALSAASSAVTFVAQASGGAVSGLQKYPLLDRAANALVSCVGYLGKTFAPANLAVFYPHPRSIPGGAPSLWQPAAAALLLAALLAGTFLAARRRPWLGFGWWWYLGTLVPVSGLVQVGEQAMADRYTYLPHVGIFVAAVWGMAELARRTPRAAPRVALCAAAIVGASAFAARAQLGYWRDEATLFTRAMEVTRGNWLAHNNLGKALADQKRFAEAVPHYREALRIRPDYTTALSNLGVALSELGVPLEAVPRFREAIRLDPAFTGARYNLACSLVLLGRVQEAEREYREVLRLEPRYAEAANNLAILLARRGRLEEATAHLAEALRVRPDFLEAWLNLGLYLGRMGKYGEAVPALREAVRLAPANPVAYEQLGAALAAAGSRQDAEVAFSIARRLRTGPADPAFRPSRP